MNEEYYVRDGVNYERVTCILDYYIPPELVSWKIRVGLKEANRVSKVATKMGSRVHELIEKNGWATTKDAEEVKNCMKAWESFKSDYSISDKDLIHGTTLYCEKRMIAGTPDFCLTFPTGVVLVDIKTSREVKPIHFYQLGGYASMMAFTPKYMAILRLDKGLGQYEYVTNEKLGVSIEQCITAFNYKLGDYRFYKLLQSRINPDRALPGNEEV